MSQKETLRLFDLDIFFISYDEPNAEENWLIAKQLIPHIKRIHRVDGFNSAYKLCAQASTTPYYVTIDADNQVRWEFKNTEVSLSKGVSAYSWGAMNSINSLVYGNGGIKCWNRDDALAMQTHEDGDEDSDALDFCWAMQFQKCPEILSDVAMNSDAYHAFRAGFREGVKMSLDQGEKQSPDIFVERAAKNLITMNMKRLAIWCSVGSDKPFGKWAIFGARLGCLRAFDHQFSLEHISDYEWFKAYWRKPITLPNESTAQPPLSDWTDTQLDILTEKLGIAIQRLIGMPVAVLTPQQNDFYRFSIVHPPRKGLQ